MARRLQYVAGICMQLNTELSFPLHRPNSLATRQHIIFRRHTCRQSRSPLVHAARLLHAIRSRSSFHHYPASFSRVQLGRPTFAFGSIPNDTLACICTRSTSTATWRSTCGFYPSFVLLQLSVKFNYDASNSRIARRKANLPRHMDQSVRMHAYAVYCEHGASAGGDGRTGTGVRHISPLIAELYPKRLLTWLAGASRLWNVQAFTACTCMWP